MNDCASILCQENFLKGIRTDIQRKPETEFKNINLMFLFVCFEKTMQLVIAGLVIKVENASQKENMKSLKVFPINIQINTLVKENLKTSEA